MYYDKISTVLTSQKKEVFAQITQWVLLLSLVATPLFFLPIFDNALPTSKTLLIFITTLVLFSVFCVRATTKGMIRVAFSPLAGTVVLFGLAVVASSFSSNQYPIKNILGMGGVYFCAIVIALMGGSLLSKKNVQFFITSLEVSGAAIAVATLLQITGFGPSWILNSMFGSKLAQDLSFNLVGSPFIATQFLAVTIVTLVAAITIKKKVSQSTLITLPIILLGFLANLMVILPGKIASPLLLPFSASWSIALDVLRSPRTAFIGIGPEYFGNAYSIFKPLWINDQEWWSVLFTQASNVPLTLLTTMGLFGLLTWIALVWNSVIQLKNKHDKDVLIIALSATSIFVLQFLFAANMVMLLLMGVVLAYLIAASSQKKAHIQTFAIKFNSGTQLGKQKQPVASFVIATVGVLVLISSVYFLGRAYLASYYMYKSYRAITQSNAITVYDYQKRALALNQYLDHYHRNYANINMQIAIALSNKADATKEEQTQVAQLVQQAIREARAATVLNPDNSQNWLTLAQIYSNLIGLSEDAPQWAINAYVKAIETAPTSPTLRSQLGGLLYNQEQYTQALNLFQQAADLKPNLPNTYYSAANTLVKLNQLEQAKLAYQKTLLLLEPDSDSYIQASQELAQVEEQLEAAMETKETTEAPQAQPTNQQQVPSILDQTVTQASDNLLDVADDEKLPDQNIEATTSGQTNSNAEIDL